MPSINSLAAAKDILKSKECFILISIIYYFGEGAKRPPRIENDATPNATNCSGMELFSSAKITAPTEKIMALKLIEPTTIR